MVISRRAAVGSIVTGSAMLCLVLFAVICGAIHLHMLSVNDTFDSVGLWSLCCVVPGILSIMAGIKKHGGLMRLALFFNILALIISGAALITLSLFVGFLNGEFSPEACGKFDNDHDDHCGCPDKSFNISCRDMPTLLLILFTTLVVYIFLTLTAFSASIFGCSSTCCAPILMDDPEDMSSGLSMLPDTSYQVTCRVMW